MNGEYLKSGIKWADIKIFDAMPSRKMIVWAMDGILKMVFVYGGLKEVRKVLKHNPEEACHYFDKSIQFVDYNYEWTIIILDEYYEMEK